jgi:2-oxoisovalerate dehydrogenase E1 component
MADDLDPLEQHLLAALAALEPASIPRPAAPVAEALWSAQIASRNCDFAARWLQKEGRSFYTIGSAGHESNAAVALALRPTDPALLHYRSGAFYLARASQTGRDGVPDIMQGVTASVDEPIAGGRHKVFGHHDLAVIPQTSTIASHLPRAVGVAIAIDRARKLGVECVWPSDAIVVCSFGDASLNHATAQAALNTTSHAAHQFLPVPLLFVCEDNGLGISVPSPTGWVAEALSSRIDLRYETVAGDDPEAVLETAQALAAWVREHRRPAVLHLRTVRYLGHAGADVEAAYRSPHELRADLDRDPLLATAQWLVASGRRTGNELAGEYLESRARVREVGRDAARRPQLATATEVIRPLASHTPDANAAQARRA